VEAQARSERSGKRFAVVIADLDHFKQVNDTLGHGPGDSLLLQISQRWRAVLRPTDVLIRLGGDEFVMILEEIDQGQLERVLHRIVLATGHEFDAGGITVPIGVSMGVSISSGSLASGTVLLRQADEALYISKSKKMNRDKCYLIYGCTE
jgi:diguanylate cyclase (GGDEF)-like protein